MSKDAEVAELQRQLVANQKQVQDLQINYSRAESTRVVGELQQLGYKFDRAKMLERMTKLDDAARKELAEEIRINYQREDRPLTHDQMIGVADDPNVNTPESKIDRVDYSAQENLEIIKYCEAKKLDPENEEDYRTAALAVLSRKKK